jgi:serine/threonine-protein kinase
LPFDAKSAMDFIQLHVTGKPVPLNQRVPGKTFPAALEQIIGRALAKRPDERFTSAAEFAGAMQVVLQGGTPSHSQIALGANATIDLRPSPTGDAVARAPVATGSLVNAAVATVPMAAPPGDRALSYSPPSTRSARGANVVLLVGVAIAFLLIGIGLAVLMMRFVIR